MLKIINLLPIFEDEVLIGSAIQFTVDDFKNRNAIDDFRILIHLYGCYLLDEFNMTLDDDFKIMNFDIIYSSFRKLIKNIKEDELKYIHLEYNYEIGYNLCIVTIKSDE